MTQGGLSKVIRCPNCGNIMTITGFAGEKKVINCDQCGTKGQFKFQVQPTVYKTRSGAFSDVDIIQVKNLKKSYKDVVAVDHISFSVKKGEIFGFLGPNGAGKTTTIRLLLGFLRPDDGEAYISGKSIRDDIVAIRRMVGYIPGELALYEHLTGRQFLEYFAQIRDTDLSLLDDLLKIFDLPLDRKIKGYSKGMKQKMGIVQAFMDDPEIVIMDEPTSGLDPLLQQKFYRFLRKEKDKGRTMFFSSHILSEVDKICDRVGIIRNGSLVALEHIETLKQKTAKKIRVKIKEDASDLLQYPEVQAVDEWIEITTHDSIDTWIKRLSSYTVLQIEMKDFSLEDYFMRYYSSEEGS